MKIAEFEQINLEKNKSLIEPYLNKDYYFVAVCNATDYRCCCRRFDFYIEVHDNISFDQLKTWFISKKTDYSEIESIMISKELDDLLNDRLNNLIGKADLEYKIKDYKNSIWKGHWRGEQFEEKYEH